MGNCCGGGLKHQGSDSLELTKKGFVKESKASTDQRLRTWKLGIVSLRGGNLKALPKALLEVAANVRNLDAAQNKLEDFPAMIGVMTQLQRLVLSENRISKISVPLAPLAMLKVLILDNNTLSVLPPDIGSCAALEKLSVAHNGLTSLPPSLGALTRLKTLSLSHNALASLPPELGACAALEVLEAASNRVEAIPPELSALQKLITLDLNSNFVAAIPPPILLSCTMLQTLNLHANPITHEMMEETEGFLHFETRRQAKYSRSIAGGALINNAGLDAGVDIPTETKGK